MRAQCSFWLAGRAAGVKDCCFVVRGNLAIGKFHIGQRCIVVRRADDILEPLGTLRRVIAARDKYRLESWKFRPVFHEPIPPLRIADEQFRTGIGEAECKFGTRPPGIERHADRPDHRRREECNRPFGQIAHRQRDPVALLDTARAEFASET